MKVVTAIAIAALLSACGTKDTTGPGNKESEQARRTGADQPAANTGGAPAAEPADGRRVPVEVKADGYHPATIVAAPNESLVLEFTRTADTHCGEVITVAGTDIKSELPLDEPVDIPVTAPASGELVFACGMDMMHGIISVK